MMILFNYRFSLWFVLFLFSLTGCKVFEPLPSSSAVKVPTSFTGKTDTLSVGNMARKDFFTDAVLVSLIDTALRNNLDLRMATQRIEMARTQVWLGKGAFLPSINAVATAGVDKFGDYTMNGVGNYDTNLSDNIDSDRRIPNPTPDYFLGLRSSWEIDVWGKLRNQKRAAYARFLATEKARHLITTALVAEVGSLYYELLALDNEMEVVRKNIRLQETAVEMITIQKEGGRANELAVKQFTAQLLNTRSLEVQLRQQLVETENLLNLLLGRYPQPIVRGKPIRAQEVPADVQAGVPSNMLRRRPDIQQAELELVAAKADVQAARAAFLPSLTLTSYMGFNSFRSAMFFNPGSLAYGALAGLSAPLFNQNRLKASHRRALAENMGAYYGYQKTVINGFREVVTSLNGIVNYGQVSSLKAQELETLSQAVTDSKVLFKAGSASYLEVITAQRTVLEAELGLVQAKKQQFLSLIELYRALGGGWE
jgi:NodT family efflux transporter outer membrane factor (OMF) lipoprotein